MFEFVNIEQRLIAQNEHQKSTACISKDSTGRSLHMYFWEFLSQSAKFRKENIYTKLMHNLLLTVPTVHLFSQSTAPAVKLGNMIINS